MIINVQLKFLSCVLLIESGHCNRHSFVLFLGLYTCMFLSWCMDLICTHHMHIIIINILLRTNGIAIRSIIIAQIIIWYRSDDLCFLSWTLFDYLWWYHHTLSTWTWTRTRRYYRDDSRLILINNGCNYSLLPCVSSGNCSDLFIRAFSNLVCHLLRFNDITRVVRGTRIQITIDYPLALNIRNDDLRCYSGVPFDVIVWVISH